MAHPPNRLAQEPSAYLKSAVHQPVHWYPWGEEAFRRAKAEDKPILLDIGAIWCHWCHVMDRESYENPEIAEIINTHFIPIKVDRDERPDIDRRYQQAVGALTGQGGWPLTAFLTWEGKVFYGGTYFPSTDAYNRPSFTTLLTRLSEAYRQEHATVFAQAEKLFDALSDTRRGRTHTAPTAGTVPSHELLHQVVTLMTRYSDPIHGGFGSAPKFPHPGATDLLLIRHWETGDRNLHRIVETTLTKMARGGVYDQIGGGFHRYSVDEKWIVPHFEKMSYDNSENLKSYLLAYDVTGDPFYKEVAEGVIRFIQEVLSDPLHGGFYASQDADINLEDDGDYFTWTKQEVEEVLTPEEVQVISLHYNVYPRGEMHHNPAKNVLFVEFEVPEVANRLSLPEEKVRSLLTSAKAKMAEARRKRPTPFVDRTLYVNWNGMMISAFLRAYRILDREDCRDQALRTLDLLLDTCFTEEKGFLHSLAGGAARIAGLADDQVKGAIALLDAYEVTGNPLYLARARRLALLLTERFYDSAEGGFFDIEEGRGEAAPLTTRHKPLQDDPVPSVNGSAIYLLDRLFYLTGDPLYRETAEKTLTFFASQAGELGLFSATYFLSLHHHLTHPPQVVIVGERGEKRTHELWKAAREIYRPHAILLPLTPSHLPSTTLPPTLQGMMKATEKPTAPSYGATAFVCAGEACAEPTGDPETLKSTLRTFGLKREAEE